MTTKSNTALIACLAIAGAFTAGFLTGPASAQKNPEPFQFQFAYTAEDMASLPSAKVLLARLERDVRGYCGANRKMTLNERSMVEACIATTMKDTIAKFGNATVAQAFQSRADG